ncbi:MAG: efflux RND transporter periplasmic adaptor subunit [Methyloprofundus sp.]|nr:efflux RND transporter periplasmic adaptor subunit [Methyloprofundus sp.]MDT8425716.1 efflux RND transporter periplasmic adaptor subunit [Methyloprofundus sp.]
MREFIVLVICFFSTSLFATQQIKISEAQIYNLGIKLDKLQTIQSVPLLDAPAKVSIPPVNEYFVSTSYAGLVSQINASVGDEVAKGQVLATVKSAELLTLQQHHLSSINDLQLAKADYVRDQQLYKEGVIADRRWLQTKTRYNVFMAHFNETRQLLEISGMSEKDINALEKTRKLSSQLNVVAPISGIILERNIMAGERVDALAPLFRVANLDTLWLDISVPQQHISQVRLGDRVVIDGLGATACIFLLGRHIDEQNQTVLVRAEITDTQGNVRLGQTVNVKISQNSAAPLFKVPNAALAQSSGITYLFIRTKEGFTAQPVQVIGREATESIISGDLSASSEIASKGAVALKATMLGLGGDE